MLQINAWLSLKRLIIFLRNDKWSSYISSFSSRDNKLITAKINICTSKVGTIWVNISVLLLFGKSTLVTMIEFQNCCMLSSELRITVTLYVLYFKGKKKCSRVEFFMLFKLKTDMYLINVPTRQKRRQAKKKDRVFLKGMFGSASFMGLFTPFKSSDFWSALEISFVLPKSDWPHGGMDRNQTCLQTYTDETWTILAQYLHNTKTILEQYSHYTFTILTPY